MVIAYENESYQIYEQLQIQIPNRFKNEEVNSRSLRPRSAPLLLSLYGCSEGWG
jgi:hypothetical protein